VFRGSAFLRVNHETHERNTKTPSTVISVF
jgi:hypothetical protein